MNCLLISLLMAWPMGASPASRHASKPASATVVFRADFNGPDALAGWSGTSGRLAAGRGGTSGLLIERNDPSASAMRRIPIPAERLAGRRVTLEAAVKAERVSEPPKTWNGIKVMLVLETEHGKQHPQIVLPVGTFDWTTVSRTIRVSKRTVKATLCVGLERVGGKVWFDDLEIRVGHPNRHGRRSEVRFKGHDLPRLRGVMHGPRFRDNDLRDLATEWGANQVRWQLNWTPMKKAETWAKDLDRYDRWLDEALAACDQALGACEKYGLLALVDLHAPPGGRAEAGVCRMFQERRYQDKLLDVWRRIAKRYKGRKVVYAYDLLNEPVEGVVATGLLNWRDLATEVTRAIRAIDPGKPVVFEPGPWGSPNGFDAIEPLNVDRVVYSFHMYMPHRFTHQGVHGNPTGVPYPGVVNGEMWDKDRLREAIMPAIDFQREFNVQIYVGEFSAIRWAPDNGAYRYLRDVIDLFEEQGWDWSYHAFREWPGWSVEHGPDPRNNSPSPTRTDRQKLLWKWFAKNDRPR